MPPDDEFHPYALELGITPALIAERRLCAFAEAVVLEPAEIGADGRQHLLIPGAARAWREMAAAAEDDGIRIFIVSAFRSVERQADILRRKLAAGLSIERILAVSAPPGFSEHHTGRAVDVATPGVAVLEESFADTAAFAWLERRAADFDFRLSYPAGNPQGYRYEPWHWCYREDDAEPTLLIPT